MNLFSTFKSVNFRPYDLVRYFSVLLLQVLHFQRFRSDVLKIYKLVGLQFTATLRRHAVIDSKLTHYMSYTF